MCDIDRRIVMGGVLWALPISRAFPQARWPEGPVKVVVPFAAAGATDTGARNWAEGVSRVIGQSFIIENKPGAGGNVGIEATALAAPDGYTLMMGTQAMITWNPHLYGNLRKDPRRDLVPVAQVYSLDMVMVVSPKLGVKNVAQVIALARSRPGKLNYGSAGNGSAAHILMEFFKAETGTDLVHVPYRGTAPALNDLVAGSLDLMFDSVPSALGMIEGKTVIPVAVCGSKRNPRMPAVPTMVEAGFPKIDAVPWLGVFAPVGTPAAILSRLESATRAAVSDAANAERARKIGLDADFAGATDLARRIERESAFWGGVIARAGIKLG